MNLVLNKEEIGKRLRQFGEENFEKVKDFADALDMSPNSLQVSYLSGRNAPGSPLLAKLIILGCDIEWLLLGNKKNGKNDIDELKAEIRYYKHQLSAIQEILNKKEIK